MREALLEGRAQCQILVQQLRVVLVGEPARTPRLVEPEPESDRMNFLAHGYSFAFCDSFFDGVVADFIARARFGRGASAPGVPTATTFSARSETCTVRCAVRFRTRNARPIGAGRTRLADGPWFAKHADTNSRSTSPLNPSRPCAFAIADRSTFAMSSATDLRVNLSVASARLT